MVLIGRIAPTTSTILVNSAVSNLPAQEKGRFLQDRAGDLATADLF
jgi:hypothetical protein